jgi:hypothetical protein
MFPREKKRLDGQGKQPRVFGEYKTREKKKKRKS